MEENPGYKLRYEAFMLDVDHWACKHKISTASAMSILNNDNTADDITQKELYEWVEINAFYGTYLEEKKEKRNV